MVSGQLPNLISTKWADFRCIYFRPHNESKIKFIKIINQTSKIELWISIRLNVNSLIVHKPSLCSYHQCVLRVLLMCSFKLRILEVALKKRTSASYSLTVLKKQKWLDCSKCVLLFIFKLNSWLLKKVF